MPFKKGHTINNGRKLKPQQGFQKGHPSFYKGYFLKKVCIFCKKEFRLKPSRFKEKKFCSWKCRQNYNKQYKNIIIDCVICNKQFAISISKTKGTLGKFCSRQCFHKWHKTIIGKNHWSWTRRKVKCRICEKETYIPLYRYKKDKVFYCSQKCQHSVVEKLYGGQKQYWRYHRQRRKALMRKGGKLSIQTIQQVYEDNIKKYGTLTCIYCLKQIEFGQDSLEHKQPLILGGTNKKENLAIACQRCNSRKRHKTEQEFLEVIKNATKRN